MHALRVALLAGALLASVLVVAPVAAADHPVHVCHPAVIVGEGCSTSTYDCTVWVTLGHPSFACVKVH